MTRISDMQARRVELDGIGAFLADYAAILLKSGATCMRIDRNIDRIARRWGVEYSMTIMPRHIHMSVRDNGGCHNTFISSIGKSEISYGIIAGLSRLSWRIADGGLSLSEAREHLRSIGEAPRAAGAWVLLAVSCANAAFCRLFGGDIVAMAIVFVSTMCGYYLKQTLLRNGCDVRLVFILCAFVSSVLASGGTLFSLGSTAEVATATSVLYLVPGIPFLNAFSDMADRHYICFFSRMTDAVVLTCCLSAGLCAGLKLMEIGMF